MRTRSRGPGRSTSPRLPAVPELQAGYLAPKPARRSYGDKRVIGADVMPTGRVVSPSLVDALRAMLDAHALDWSTTQLANCRGYLLSPTGRFLSWCAMHGVVAASDLTTDGVAAFLAAVSDRRSGPGLKPATVTKYRTHLRALARFLEETPGYESSLRDIDRIPAPRMPKERFPIALTRDEEARVVHACVETRDGLVIELFLATGLRGSEMAAVTLPNLMLHARPPRVAVTGSVHDPECTKNGHPRQVPFRKTYASLPRRLEQWIATERDPQRRSGHQELFLNDYRHRRRSGAAPLGIFGFESICRRIARRAGVHFSPHVLRHTWATRLVDAGVKPMHLMVAGGWSSIEMVRRYYTANDEEVLAALSAALA